MNAENTEIILRIRDLEQFKQNLQTKLTVAWWVASILGIASLLGGAWINNLYDKLDKQEKRTIAIEATLETVEKEIADASKALKSQNEEYIRVMSERFNKVILSAESEINNAAEKKKTEISKIGTNELIDMLRNGSIDMNLRSLSISNNNGVKVINMRSDSGGDGIIIMNSDAGDVRYTAKLINDNAISTFYNSSGKVVLNIGAASDTSDGFIIISNSLNGKRSLQIDGGNNSGNIRTYTAEGKQRYWLTVDNGSPIERFYNKDSKAVVGLGAFNDGNKGFFRVYDPRDDKIVAEISGSEDGGRSFFYTQDGKQLIYIGPAANTGDALVKLNTRYGKKVKDITPNN